MTKFLTALAAVGAFAISGAAQAASYTFDFTYDGTAIMQSPGSDDPDGTELFVGDNFTINFTATDGFFRALSDISQFVPMSFALTEEADRTATIQTQFLLNGVVVDFTSESVIQSSVHAGAQNFEFDSGFEFDEISLFWVFDEISDDMIETVISTAFSPEIFNSFGNTDRPFFNDPDLAFITGADPVPLPGAALLFATAGLIGAGVRKRKAA